VSARNEALEEAAKLAKEYLLLVFVDHPWANIVPTDLHASIRRLKDKP
jgi:aspartate/methionine/tyrosine aminotransferase